ncbi:MAG: hypothetical protein AB1635_21245 [Acidobacteriota bacterium]
MHDSLLRKPSALAPMAMSLVALAVVGGYLALYGAARQADEGTAAHLWQLLMAGQLPIVGYFAITWLPGQPRAAVKVLAIQLALFLASILPIWWFEW